jgi:hypothetical protein
MATGPVARAFAGRSAGLDCCSCDVGFRRWTRQPSSSAALRIWLRSRRGRPVPARTPIARSGPVSLAVLTQRRHGVLRQGQGPPRLLRLGITVQPDRPPHRDARRYRQPRIRVAVQVDVIPSQRPASAVRIRESRTGSRRRTRRRRDEGDPFGSVLGPSRSHVASDTCGAKGTRTPGLLDANYRRGAGRGQTAQRSGYPDDGPRQP